MSSHSLSEANWLLYVPRSFIDSKALIDAACSSVFRNILIPNSHCIPQQYYPTGPCKGDALVLCSCGGNNCSG